MQPDTPASSTLRWILITAGVVGLHLAAVHSVWDAGGDPDSTQVEADSPNRTLVEGMVLAPIQASPRLARPLPTPPSVAPAPSVLSEAPSPPATPIIEPPAEDTPDTPPEVVAAAEPSPPPAAKTQPVAHPPAVTAQWQYDVNGSAKGFPYHATATMRWQLDQGRYETQLSLGAFLVGSRSQFSQGHVGPEGLEPERFVDKARKERQLHFDWSARTVQSADQAVGRPLANGTQDRLSVFMQLASLLAAMPHPPHAGQTWSIPVAGFGSTEAWEFRFQGAETLELPAGIFQTWKLQRQNADQSAELWFSPEFHHLPVRIRLSQDNGDVVDQRLSSR